MSQQNKQVANKKGKKFTAKNQADGDGQGSGGGDRSSLCHWDGSSAFFYCRRVRHRSARICCMPEYGDWRMLGSPAHQTMGWLHVVTILPIVTTDISNNYLLGCCYEQESKIVKEKEQGTSDKQIEQLIEEVHSNPCVRTKVTMQGKMFQGGGSKAYHTVKKFLGFTQKFKAEHFKLLRIGSILFHQKRQVYSADADSGSEDEFCEVKPLYSFTNVGDHEPNEEVPDLLLPPKEALGPFTNLEELIEGFNDMEISWAQDRDKWLLDYKPYPQGEPEIKLLGFVLGSFGKYSRKDTIEMDDDDMEVIDLNLEEFVEKYEKERAVDLNDKCQQEDWMS
uniref:Uncharacterized protein n=1 Tax=Romanomermis culicivorax TaxID=13658 RepID=A0A915KMB5_ROMCU